MLKEQLRRWRQQPALQRLFAVGSGALLVFAYAPFHQAWLVIPVLAGMIALLANESANNAWRLGYYFGFGWFAAGLSWIYVSIDQFGGLHPLASVIVLLLLFLYLSLFPALAFWLWRKSAHWLKDASYWTLPLFWLVTEWLRGWLLTGFPWLELGYTQTDTLFAHYAPVLGGAGISMILMLVALSLVALLRSKQIKYAVLASLLVIVPAVLSTIDFTQRTGYFADVTLVQGNIKQSIKWNPDQHWPTLSKYLELSRPHYGNADIIIWPESAITMPEPYTDEVLANMHRTTADSGTALVTGIIDYRNDEYYNSIIVLGRDGRWAVEEAYRYQHSNRYQKHQLLPVGEFVPFESLLRPLGPLFDLPMSSFSRGDYVQPNLRAAGYQLLAAICFEIAFPAQVRANFTTSTDFLLTISNDTWFGRSHGPAQHMQIARMRSLELARPLIRSTNNGITAVVDENGRYLGELPQFQTGVLVTRVPEVAGVTPFAAMGMWLTWVIALLVAAVGAFNVVNRSENR